jgi:hypothetical protein
LGISWDELVAKAKDEVEKRSRKKRREAERMSQVHKDGVLLR